nr:hypothetical protein QKQZYOMX_QKQZYOMX_CDS_0002 [Microvirus sp.]
MRPLRYDKFWCCSWCCWYYCSRWWYWCWS